MNCNCRGLYVYRAAHTVTYRAAHTVTYPLLSQITKFTLTLHYTVTTVTLLTFLLWLGQCFGCASLIQTAQPGGCVCHLQLRFQCGGSNLIYVVQVIFEDVCGLSFFRCFFFVYMIHRLGQVFCYFSESPFFVRHFVVSTWRLKCTKHMCCNSDVLQ